MKRRSERQQLCCLQQSKKIKWKWLLKALGTQSGEPFLIRVEKRMRFDISWLFPMRQMTLNHILIKITLISWCKRFYYKPVQDCPVNLKGLNVRIRRYRVTNCKNDKMGFQVIVHMKLIAHSTVPSEDICSCHLSIKGAF